MNKKANENKQITEKKKEKKKKRDLPAKSLTRV